MISGIYSKISNLIIVILKEKKKKREKEDRKERIVILFLSLLPLSFEIASLSKAVTFCIYEL